MAQEGFKMTPRGPNMKTRWRKMAEVEGKRAQLQKRSKTIGKTRFFEGPGAPRILKKEGLEAPRKPKTRPRWVQVGLKSG